MVKVEVTTTRSIIDVFSELGELTVTNLELNKLQEELDQIKQNLEEKDNQLKESLEKTRNVNSTS